MEEKLAALGWQALSDNTGLQIDGVGTPDHFIGRAWSPTGTYRALPVEDGMYVLLGIEGRATVTYNNTPMDVPRDHLTFLDAEAAIDVQLTAATARYLWKLKPTVLSNPFVRERLGEPLPVSSNVWKVVASLTNGALEAPEAFANSFHLGRASESLLAAAFDDARQYARVRPTTRPDQVFGEAMHVIDLSFQDPNCSAAFIAAELLVSERTLRRAFTLMGTTPRAEIERRRSTELRQLRGQFGTSVTFAKLVEMSGFKNVRQARAALVRP
ncbi:hypothetical protein [Microbacterium testaceum]|uniref:hypothetical protein n=1 Tax=Microbacterium testaceum TaxID=2033 RepID=UPI002AC6EA3A|nr:hypothetical protein [Microbacterium testaceum]MDZ5146293.1 hypothetical protein [Microbacterium testaceum]